MLFYPTVNAYNKIAYSHQQLSNNVPTQSVKSICQASAADKCFACSVASVASAALSTKYYISDIRIMRAQHCNAAQA